jgi:hypothetical protein
LCDALGLSASVDLGEGFRLGFAVLDAAELQVKVREWAAKFALDHKMEDDRADFAHLVPLLNKYVRGPEGCRRLLDAHEKWLINHPCGGNVLATVQGARGVTLGAMLGASKKKNREGWFGELILSGDILRWRAFTDDHLPWLSRSGQPDREHYVKAVVCASPRPLAAPATDMRRAGPALELELAISNIMNAIAGPGAPRGMRGISGSIARGALRCEDCDTVTVIYTEPLYGSKPHEDDVVDTLVLGRRVGTELTRIPGVFIYNVGPSCNFDKQADKHLTATHITDPNSKWLLGALRPHKLGEEPRHFLGATLLQGAMVDVGGRLMKIDSVFVHAYTAAAPSNWLRGSVLLNLTVQQCLRRLQVRFQVSVKSPPPASVALLS